MANIDRIGLWTLVVAGGAIWPMSCAGPEASRPPQLAELAQAITPPDRDGPPEPLSLTAKALLKERMAMHAQDMSQLVSSIMLLEYAEISTDADKIASDVNLHRPTSNDATQLTESIPEKFFVRQDDLQTAARILAKAGRTANPDRVADAYGKLAETCVRCHADYRPRD